MSARIDALVAIVDVDWPAGSVVLAVGTADQVIRVDLAQDAVQQLARAFLLVTPEVRQRMLAVIAQLPTRAKREKLAAAIGPQFLAVRGKVHSSPTAERQAQTEAYARLGVELSKGLETAAKVLVGGELRLATRVTEVPTTRTTVSIRDQKGRIAETLTEQEESSVA